jgi:hypothetical protein
MKAGTEAPRVFFAGEGRWNPRKFKTEDKYFCRPSRSTEPDRLQGVRGSKLPQVKAQGDVWQAVEQHGGGIVVVRRKGYPGTLRVDALMGRIDVRQPLR